MALLSTKNWTLSSYTNNTWTDFVAEPAIIAAIVISNTSGASVAVSLRLSDGAGSSLAVFVPESTINANESYSVDVRSLNVTGTQTLQIFANAAGVNFIASGSV